MAQSFDEKIYIQRELYNAFSICPQNPKYIPHTVWKQVSKQQKGNRTLSSPFFSPFYPSKKGVLISYQKPELIVRPTGRDTWIASGKNRGYWLKLDVRELKIT